MIDEQTAGKGQLGGHATSICWVAGVVFAASLQGFRIRVPGASADSGWHSLISGVSLGSLLFVVACWLPLLVATAGPRTATERLRLLIKESQTRLLAGCWLAWVGASSVSAALSEHAWLGLRASVEIAAIGIAFLGLYLWFQQIPRASRAATIQLGLYCAITLLAVLGAVEMLFPQATLFEIARTSASRSIFPRIAGIMSWPTAYGLVIVVGLVVGSRRSIGGRARLLLLGSQGLLLSQLAVSGSRNAWATFVVAGLILLLLGHSRRQVVASAALLGLLVVAIPVSARQAGMSAPLIEGLVQWLPTTSLSSSEQEQLQQRASSWSDAIGTPEANSLQNSMDARQQLWLAAVETIRERPLTGIGAGSFASTVGRRVTGNVGLNAHSLPLNVFAETGLLGLCALLLFGYAFARPFTASSGSSRRRVASEETVWLALAVLFIGQVFDCLTYDRVLVSIWTVLAALAWSLRPSSETTVDLALDPAS